jgi:Signal transduction histidine kinase regulating citrate/malate metabolism
VIAGFLLSKINRTSDLGHSLVISNESQLPENSNEDQVAVLITVLGKSD